MKGIVLSSMQGGAMSVVVLVIVLAVGAQILGQISNTQSAGTVEKNITTAGLSALGQFGNWFTIIVLVIIAVVIISLLVRGLGGLGSNEGG